KEEPIVIITPNGVEQGAFEHSLKGNLVNLGLETSFLYNPFGGLLISLGTRIGMNLINKFEQVETITKPTGYGTFLDSLGNDSGKRTRNEYSGEIPNANSFQTFLLLGISYELPLNKTKSFRLVPELLFQYPLMEISQNTDWKVQSTRGLISLKYTPTPKLPKIRLQERKFDIDTVRIIADNVDADSIVLGKEIRKVEVEENEENIVEYTIIIRTDTLFRKKLYLLDGSITAVGVDENGSEIPNPVFKIEEFVSNRLDPLLNYVFFEEGSSEIPSRYKKLSSSEAKKFSINSLFYDNTIDIYYHILNIIGQRLQEYPKAKLTVVGCNSNIGIEKMNLQLSEARARQVKEYLVDIWEIDPERIIIEKRNLPSKPSTPFNDPVKAEENRRVELYSDDERILEWIFIEKVDAQASPPIVRFKTSVVSEAGIKNWEISAYQSATPDLKFIAKGQGTLVESVDWRLEDFQKIIPRKPEPIVYNLILNDMKGNHTEVIGKTLPIVVRSIKTKREERVEDYIIERFSLILFDFDKATIEGLNKRIVEFIRNRVQPISQISIYGYTDYTGEEDYNLQLSERRAQATKEALMRPDATANGRGEQKLLYNNSIPEGRFYCRTVEIIVKTKVE
ncbi:MAG: OmpA family protein, partial [Candidatus Kapaibacteriota bacterium]